MSRIRIILGILVLIAIVLTGALVLGSAGFTSGTAARNATIDVVGDKDGFVALRDGNPNGGFVTQGPDGILGIDFTTGGGTGANTDATFVIGSTTDPLNTHAFRIINQDSRTHDITVEYTLSSTGGEDGGPESLTFTFYHDIGGDNSLSGDPSYEITENTGTNQATITNVASGEIVYTIVTVDTTGLSSTNDLSGTLNITVGTT